MDGWGVAEEEYRMKVSGWLVGIIVRRMGMVAFAGQGVSE